eukprot:7959210-Pyramimonas_sp.AAC.1
MRGLEWGWRGPGGGPGGSPGGGQEGAPGGGQEGPPGGGQGRIRPFPCGGVGRDVSPPNDSWSPRLRRHIMHT